MKSLLLIALGFLSSGTAFADCDDGMIVSSKAALELANKRYGVCKISGGKQTTSWPTERLESWVIDVTCPNIPLRSFAVSLKACAVTKIRLKPLPGSQCQLSDLWGGDFAQQWIFDAFKTVSLRGMSSAQLELLNESTKEQLRFVAEAKGQDIVKVADYLKDSSQTGEVHVYHFDFRGRKFDAVQFYPNGDAYGSIFEHGTLNLVANNTGTQVTCVERRRADLSLPETKSDSRVELALKGRDCSAPWGTPVRDGGMIRAYAEARPRRGDQCRYEYRTCRNGYLSGSYRYDFCSPNI